MGDDKRRKKGVSTEANGDNEERREDRGWGKSEGPAAKGRSAAEPQPKMMKGGDTKGEVEFNRG